MTAIGVMLLAFGSITSFPSMKLALAIISDPRAGEESLARLLNAFAAASDVSQAGHETEIVFIGTGTRWPAELVNPLHAAHGAYQGVRPLVAGASRACASAFGATEGLRQAGVPEKHDNPIPGTAGALSLRRYLEEDWKLLVF